MRRWWLRSVDVLSSSQGKTERPPFLSGLFLVGRPSGSLAGYSQQLRGFLIYEAVGEERVQRVPLFGPDLLATQQIHDVAWKLKGHFVATRTEDAVVHKFTLLAAGAVLQVLPERCLCQCHGCLL
jgi:hypothetical protein